MVFWIKKSLGQKKFQTLFFVLDTNDAVVEWALTVWETVKGWKWSKRSLYQNSLGEWNSSGNCFSPSLDMWSEGKRSEMKQTEIVSKYADNSAFIALYDWCERCSLYLQPPKVPQTFWCELSSPYLQPQTVSQTVLMRTVFALFPTSKGSPNLWSYAEVGLKRSGDRPF